MKDFQAHTIIARTRRNLALVALCALALTLLIVVNSSQAQSTQEARPRRAGSAQTTPTPAKTAAPPVLKDEPPVMPTPKPTPTPDDQQGQELDPNDVIKIDTSLVNLNVRVIDRTNRPISNVRQEEFRIFEDGVPQKIEFFSKEEVPISYGLAIDTSQSLRSQIDKVIEAGQIIIDNNKPGDETFLVRFVSSDKIETALDFSSDKKLLKETLGDFYLDGGQTAVIDAVYLSAEHVAQYKKDDNDRRRRALIVITDGEDRASFYKQDQLFARLREEDVQIYVIGFVNELDKDDGGIIKKSSREKAVNLLERMAKETGGRAFFPNSLTELPGIAQEITRDMRTQYVISYNPTDASGRIRPRDGSYRSVRVTVADAAGKDKRIALTRAGYTAPLEGGGSKPGPAPRPAIGARKTS